MCGRTRRERGKGDLEESDWKQTDDILDLRLRLHATCMYVCAHTCTTIPGTLVGYFKIEKHIHTLKYT